MANIVKKYCVNCFESLDNPKFMYCWDCTQSKKTGLFEKCTHIKPNGEQCNILIYGSKCYYHREFIKKRAPAKFLGPA